MTNKEQQFESVYNEYYPRILRHINKKIGIYHEAEDLTQEIMAACYRNFEKYDPEKSSMGTWVYVIMNNRLKNYYRDKRVNVSLDDDESFLELASEEILEEAVLLEEQKRVLMEAIASLSEREKEIVMNTYFLHKTSAEVAEVMHMTAGNVRVVLNRSIKKLREYFEARGY